MKCGRPRGWTKMLILAGIGGVAAASPARAQWPQWGGPNRDFTVQTEGLADRWPSGGPPKIWHRTLGDGYAAIVVDDGVLYTMYRRTLAARHEVTVALDAGNGSTIWEHRYSEPLTRPVDQSGWGGKGPNATPLVVDDRVISVGSHAAMHCFDKKTGEIFWMHDMAAEFGAPYPNRGEVGYSASPIAYQGTVIAPVGCGSSNRAASEQSLMAFDLRTGDVVWKCLDFSEGNSSPILIKFAGRDQLVLHCSTGLVGVDPSSGELLWKHDFQVPYVIVTPVFDGKDLIFCAPGSPNAIATAIRLRVNEGRFVTEQAWASRRIRLRVASPVHVGNCLFGSTERLFFGADVRTGERLWGKRGFNIGSCVYGDGKLIILDKDGNLTLAVPSPNGLDVRSRCQLTGPYSFIVPALVGKTLYVRDRQHIMALDVGEAASDRPERDCHRQ